MAAEAVVLSPSADCCSICLKKPSFPFFDLGVTFCAADSGRPALKCVMCKAEFVDVGLAACPLCGSSAVKPL